MEFIKVSQILSTSHLRSYRDDDLWIDRLSHRYSVVLFCVFAVLITTKAYIGNPIGLKIIAFKEAKKFLISEKNFFFFLKIVGHRLNLKSLMNNTLKHYALLMALIIYQKQKLIYPSSQMNATKIVLDIINGPHLYFYY